MVNEVETKFVYTIYIRTTPETLWRALTETAFIERYFGGGPKSRWQPGDPVLWKMDAGHDYQDWDQRVLKADPPRRLSYTWHNYQPEMRKYFGWSDEQLAEMRKERISKVTFEIEPAGEQVKLTLIHDDFAPGSEMLKGTREGWPMILSGLKTLLETEGALSR